MRAIHPARLTAAKIIAEELRVNQEHPGTARLASALDGPIDADTSIFARSAPASPDEMPMCEGCRARLAREREAAEGRSFPLHLHAQSAKHKTLHAFG